MPLKGNPFKEDEKLVELLQELDNITTRRRFQRWKKSFVAAFGIYLEESGSIKVRMSYRELCHILSRHVELVKKLHAHIQCGDMSPEGCTVRARQTLGNFFDQMIRVKQILIEILPATARMEQNIGFTKFHLAAVLIDNGFVAYDRLSLCDEIHFHFKRWCLQDVTNKLFLLEMGHFHNQLDIFCNILADLGLKGTAQKCVKFLHLDDEETIVWEGGEDSSVSDCSLSSSESDRVDLDPLPDLSEITFEDDDSLNLPLWKVNNYYRNNAEMAESFRHDMKRKSFDMFNESRKNRGKGAKPPSMPRRSFDSDTPPPPPSKPQRHPSDENLAIALKDENQVLKERDNVAQSKAEKVANLDDTKHVGNPKRHVSSQTMETAELSDSEESETSIPKETDKRNTNEQGRTKQLLKPSTSYLPTPVRQLSHVRPKPDESEPHEERDAMEEELKRKTSFYSFASYYHGSPSDWRIRKVDQWAHDWLCAIIEYWLGKKVHSKKNISHNTQLNLNSAHMVS